MRLLKLSLIGVFPLLLAACCSATIWMRVARQSG